MIFKAIVVLALIVFITAIAKYNLGIVTLSLTNLRIETSLNFFIVISLITFLLFYSLLRTYKIFGLIPQVVKGFFLKRSEKDSESNFIQANLDFILENYKESYALSTKAARKYHCSQRQILAYFLAFKSAVKLADVAKQNEIISFLDKINISRWKLAKDLIIAQGLYDQNNFTQAMKYIVAAQKIDENNPAVKQLSNQIKAVNSLIVDKQ